MTRPDRGTLFLVSTPIGNLGDITLRALDTLRAVDRIVAEDTRHSRRLLEHFGIQKPMWSLPGFEERGRSERVLEAVANGEQVAVVTDAGTPGISDPGEALVAEARARGLHVVPIPGVSAAITALSAAGLPTGRFHFLGFLPRKGSERRRLLEDAGRLSATLILYESPRRLAATLRELAELYGERRATVARELTKLHEEFASESLERLAERYEAEETLGEVVLLVEGRAPEAKWDEERVRAAVAEGLARGERLKPLSRDVARESGWSAGDVYRLGVARKG